MPTPAPWTLSDPTECSWITEPGTAMFCAVPASSEWTDGTCRRPLCHEHEEVARAVGWTECSQRRRVVLLLEVEPDGDLAGELDGIGEFLYLGGIARHLLVPEPITVHDHELLDELLNELADEEPDEHEEQITVRMARRLTEQTEEELAAEARRQHGWTEVRRQGTEDIVWSGPGTTIPAGTLEPGLYQIRHHEPDGAHSTPWSGPVEFAPGPPAPELTMAPAEKYGTRGPDCVFASTDDHPPSWCTTHELICEEPF